jgi:hypothetical protein
MSSTAGHAVLDVSRHERQSPVEKGNAIRPWGHTLPFEERRDLTVARVSRFEVGQARAGHHQIG